MNRIAVIVTLCLATTLAQAASDYKPVRDALQKALPTAKIDDVRPSPIDGIAEALIGASVYYMTEDGRYVFQGSLIDMQTRTDLTEERLKGVRSDLIGKVSEDDMIVFPAKDPRHTVTVFTDVDCGYCRKLHNEIDVYNDKGISVRYLLYPRNGVNTPTYMKSMSVWCSKDRQQALTLAKAGETIEPGVCDNPLSATQQLGSQLGVRGTPAIVLESGDVLPGYVPAGELSHLLDKQQ